MEKVININFQGRVIPIEETAYNSLKAYTDGLRKHFANEESSEEIISDIENRIAELLAGRLKNGASCININDVNAVIDSIGRIEDIKAADGTEEQEQQKQQQQQHAGAAGAENMAAFNNRFFRNADDKVIAGVCSGIAIRMNVDPVIVRVLFVLLFGALFWVYILLWIIVPLQSMRSNITRRLFRNPGDKVLAGVCGGLAVYFKLESWKVRVIFLAPLIISILFKSMGIFTWHFGLAPGFFIGSFGSTFFIFYLILWIAIPYATSGTDLMEMRGEKIDINSIKAATQARTGTGAMPLPPRPAGSGIGKVIGILFKAFFLFIAGSIAISLFAVLIGLVFAGTAMTPFADFILNGWTHYAMTWIAVALTLGIPLLALIVWVIRRIMGVRSRRHYLGYIFAGLWMIGIVFVVVISGGIIRNFSTRSTVEDELQIAQPSTGRLYIAVSNVNSPWHASRYNRWFGDGDDKNMPFRILSRDSLWLNTVKVNIEQSPDSLFHVYETRASRGNNAHEARTLASHVEFGIEQLDSVITLPRGFVISRKDKFRNQQVLLTIEVPLGKNIQMSKDINEYSWFNVNSNGRGVYYTRHWDEEDGRRYGTNKEYIMTVTGLKNSADTTEKADKDADEESDDKEDNDDSKYDNNN